MSPMLAIRRHSNVSMDSVWCECCVRLRVTQCGPNLGVLPATYLARGVFRSYFCTCTSHFRAIADSSKVCQICLDFSGIEMELQTVGLVFTPSGKRARLFSFADAKGSCS